MCIFPAHVHGTDRHSGIGNGIGRLCWYYLLPWRTRLGGRMVILKKQSISLTFLWISFIPESSVAIIWGSQTQMPTGARKETSMSEGEWVLGRQQGRVGTVVDCHMHALPTGGSHSSAGI